MQVLIEDKELAEMRRIARTGGLTLAEWVRQALRAAMRGGTRTSADRKVAAIRAAARHRFPAPDIDQMLAEIERGYAFPAGAGESRVAESGE